LATILLSTLKRRKEFSREFLIISSEDHLRCEKETISKLAINLTTSEKASGFLSSQTIIVQRDRE
jgi:hypothetical protein